MYQLGACVAGAAWQVVQLRMSCGKTTSEKSTTDCWKPMIWYGVPAWTLGRFSPMWILWIITLKSTVLPVSGSVVCGEWHRTHSLTSWREPPCAESGLWQVLQALFEIMSQTVGHGRAVGTKSYSTLA